MHPFKLFHLSSDHGKKIYPQSFNCEPHQCYHELFDFCLNQNFLECVDLAHLTLSRRAMTLAPHRRFLICQHPVPY